MILPLMGGNERKWLGNRFFRIRARPCPTVRLAAAIRDCRVPDPSGNGQLREKSETFQIQKMIFQIRRVSRDRYETTALVAPPRYDRH